MNKRVGDAKLTKITVKNSSNSSPHRNWHTIIRHIEMRHNQKTVTVNAGLYHYAGNNPVRYIDPDGRISGLLNDSTAAGGFGHSAMFVQLYNEDGTTRGIAIFEVGSVFYDEINATGYGYGKFNAITNSTVLSHSTVGGISSSCKSCMDSDQAGVFVRIYEGSDAEQILTNMRNAEENKRYDNVLIMDTIMEQDMAIYSAAMELGVNFGTYRVILNNCSEYAVKALKRGGWKTRVNVIPNYERYNILKNNELRPVEDWTKKDEENLNRTE